MNNELSITVDTSDEKTFKLILKGRVNSVNANEFQKKLDSAFETKCNRIIVNMRDVSFLSSGGIRVLLMYYKIANGRKCSFYVDNPSDNVKNVLGMIALDEMLLK